MPRQSSKLATAIRAISQANAATDSDFIKAYLTCPTLTWRDAWTNPKTGAVYRISLTQAAAASTADLETCLNLIGATSRQDYEGSSKGWDPVDKRREMHDSNLRYLTARNERQEIVGFASLMPTLEEGEPVIYCYEIHLTEALRGTGLAKYLMWHLEVAAMNMPPVRKVMLTCFLSNAHALAFYKKLGFVTDAISPAARTLRHGTVVAPEYVILSKTVS